MGSYWFAPREECERRDMAKTWKHEYLAGYSADSKLAVGLDVLDNELCQLIHGEDAHPKRYSGYFNNATDILYNSLYKLGGSYVEHYHWSCYIEPLFDRCIKEAETSKEKKDLILLKWITHEWSMKRYRFYATG